jgi:putative endonuclease
MNKSEKNKAIGKEGELVAQNFLLNRGFLLAETNYWARSGEIDIIFWDDKYLVFAEVKSSGKINDYHLGLRVNLKKQRKIIATALDYMTKHNPVVSGYRFDVILVQKVSNNEHKIEHIKDAFYVEESGGYD